MNYFWAALVVVCLGGVKSQITDEQIRVISDQIWQADSNRINGNDVQYNINGPKLFTYVNEARFTGTYARFIALINNYVANTGVPDQCNTQCQQERDAFLDAILQTQPIRLLHNWLYGNGLASQSQAGFKEELRQYFFYAYTRSGGPLDSSGFEHVFLGEIDGGQTKGFHNWVAAYYAEKDGSFVYGSHQATCPNEVIKFTFRWNNYQKPTSSLFVRTSPEVEVALYTLCLLTRNGNCPTRRNGVNVNLTVWDMTNHPKTIGSAYPNC